MPLRSEYEEWRLAFEVPEGGPDPSTLVDSLRRGLPPHVDVHRKGGREIRIYAGTRADIDHAFRVVGGELVAHGVQTDILLSRWNPGAERWQEPSLPIEMEPKPLPKPWGNIGELAWEVRLRFDHDSEAERLARELRADGASVLRGWNRCLMPVADEPTAQKWMAALRIREPTAEIEVRPTSRFRRWMIRQQLFKNYGDSSAG